MSDVDWLRLGSLSKKETGYECSGGRSLRRRESTDGAIEGLAPFR